MLKKYKQAQGFDVFFTTGTDEQGQKLQESAIKAGKAPMEYIDPIVESAKELWRTLDINFDAFVLSTMGSIYSNGALPAFIADSCNF